MRPFPRKKKLCKDISGPFLAVSIASENRLHHSMAFAIIDTHGNPAHPRWSASLGNKAPTRTRRTASHQSAAVVTRSPLGFVSCTHNTTITHMISQISLVMCIEAMPRALCFCLRGKKIHQRKELWNAQFHKIIASCGRPPHPGQMSRAVTPHASPNMGRDWVFLKQRDSSNWDGFTIR